MFGFGSKRRRVRNDTFGPSRVRSALLAGAGMLAWRWWKNRRAAGQSPHKQGQFTETPRTPTPGVY
jgi:hypothetical protein